MTKSNKVDHVKLHAEFERARSYLLTSPHQDAVMSGQFLNTLPIYSNILQSEKNWGST